MSLSKPCSNVSVWFPFQGENDKTFGSEFVFSDHSKELIVGEIFVRVYNEQPSYPLEVRTYSLQDDFTGVLTYCLYVSLKP